MFVGALRSVTLTRPERATFSDGQEVLVVSNACGEETAAFRVIRSTAPLAAEQTLHFTIGEWCQQPVDFNQDYWLIAPGRGASDEPAAFPVFESGQAAFALVDDHFQVADGQPRLALSRLPEPVEYPFFVDLDNAQARQAILEQSALEIRNGKVWIVRGVLLSDIFPGFTRDDLN